MLRWIIRLMIAVLIISPMPALAHGDYDGPNQDSSTFGPVQSATVAVVDLKVASFADARQKVTEAALAQGARLDDIHTWVDPKGRTHGWIRFILPTNQLAAVLPPIYGVGKLYSERMTTTDYRSDSDQLARRIASLNRHEARLDSLLNSNRRMRGSDLLYIQDRLFRADVDAGMLEQRRVDMAGAEGNASLLVELFEPGTLPVTATGRIDLRAWYAASLARARLDAGRQLARIATAGAYLLVFAPVWAPALAIVWLALWLIWRRRREIIAWLLAPLRTLSSRDGNNGMQAPGLPD